MEQTHTAHTGLATADDLAGLEHHEVIDGGPDWVCELLSPSTHRNDLQVKRAEYCRAGVGHYWVIDPRARLMTVLRNNGPAFEIAEVVTADDEDIALEPFPECVMNLRLLFAANLPGSAQ
jgi:Uma2 family endonuclease